MKYIFTFHYAKNYGAFLQSFALCEAINAKIGNFEPGPALFIGRLKKILPFFWRLIALYRYWKIDHSKFPEYEMLPLSKRICSVKYVKDFNGCTAIVGSDQIWNPNFSYMQEKIYFANFSNFSRRVAYAASMGMERWPENFEKKVCPMLKKFDAISVREESSVAYLKSLGFIDAVCVCDPTLLHDGDFYREKFGLISNNSNRSFLYKIRETVPSPVNKILQESSCEYVDLGIAQTMCSVSGWLQRIDNAKFVVTDSYHCAVFCILFHKPFVILKNHGNGKGMNERFHTLLGKTDLLYRILPQDPSKNDVLDCLYRCVDWKKVDLVIDEWRNYSANWLNKALG